MDSDFNLHLINLTKAEQRRLMHHSYTTVEEVYAVLVSSPESFKDFFGSEARLNEIKAAIEKFMGPEAIARYHQAQPPLPPPGVPTDKKPNP